LKDLLFGLAAFSVAAVWPAPAVPAGAAITAAPASHGAAAVVWKPLAPGAERGVSDDATGRIEMFRFDLEHYAAEVVVGGERRPAGARVWMTGARHTAAELLRRAGDSQIVAAVNGGFFDERGRSLGLRAIHGTAAVPFRANVDWGVFFVSDRRARIVHSRDFDPTSNVEAAIQVGPRILIAGVVPRLKAQVARRTALALDRDGKTVTLVVAETPVDAAVLGSRLAAAGFDTALLLDGGPSTQIAVAGGPEIAGGYPVPDLLAIVRR
jgi:uncharacterized protein YigE (DUF2233 family)